MTHIAIELPEILWLRVAEAAGMAWPPDNAAEGMGFLQRCSREGLLPLVFAATPPVVTIANALVSFRALDTANRHRASTITRCIAELPEMLKEDFLLLKGSDVAYRLYPRSELRPMGDIDILVPEERLPGLVQRLAHHGIHQRRSRLTHFGAGNPDLAFDLGAVTLEIHQAIVHRASATIDYSDLWRQSVPAQGHQLPMRRLSNVDALVTVALNIAKDNLAAPLLRYLDIWLMMRDPTLTEQAERRARQWHVEHAFHIVIRTASLIFPDLPRPASRPFLDRCVAPKTAADTRDIARIPRLARYWRKWWLLDRLDLRLRYVAAIALASIQGWRRRTEVRQ